jgi:hypothetical protein
MGRTRTEEGQRERREPEQKIEIKSDQRRDKRTGK